MHNAHEHVQAVTPPSPVVERSYELTDAQKALQAGAVRLWAAEHGLHISNGREDATPDDAFLMFLLDAREPYAHQLSTLLCRATVSDPDVTVEELVTEYDSVLAQAQAEYGRTHVSTYHH